MRSAAEGAEGIRTWGRCVRVAPGDSITVALPEGLFDGDGFYFFEVYFWRGVSVKEDKDGYYVEYSAEKGSGDRLQFTHCRPFQIESKQEFPAKDIVGRGRR